MDPVNLDVEAVADRATVMLDENAVIRNDLAERIPAAQRGGALCRGRAEGYHQGELKCLKYQRSRSSSPSTTKVPISPVP